MAVTCTQKFNWPYIDEENERRTRIYFPGSPIEDQDAAAFAKMAGYGEERGEQAPARNLDSPENAMADLRSAGGEMKETKAERKAREKAERAAAAAQAGEPAPDPAQEA